MCGKHAGYIIFGREFSLSKLYLWEIRRSCCVSKMEKRRDGLVQRVMIGYAICWKILDHGLKGGTSSVNDP